MVYDKMIFARNLMKYIDRAHETQADISALLGVSKSSVSGWCSGQKIPRMDKVEQLASHFNISISDLLEDKERLPAGAFPYNPTHRIPVLGCVSAGLPLYAEENIEGYIWTDLNHGGEYFGLRVKGDSMNALRINDGDVLIVRRQDIVEDGDVAVVLVNGNEATVKRFSKEGSTVTLYPQSTNPEHLPQKYNLENTTVRVIGKVVENRIVY